MRRTNALPAFLIVLFLPSVVPVVAASALWIWLLDPQTGLVNHVLSQWLGLPAQGWLDSTSEAFWPPPCRRTPTRWWAPAWPVDACAPSNTRNR